MRDNYYVIEELTECIVDELNDDFDFYVELENDENNDEDNEVDFDFTYRFYDTEKIYIIGWCRWYNIGEILRYSLITDSIIDTKREFNDIVKSVKKEILSDLQNNEYIRVIPRKKGILKRILNYKNKSLDYALEKR